MKKKKTPKITVFDVASYILDQQGEMSTWKLQKLVYYSQAWALVWDDKPLFEQDFQAWINGPVCRDFYEKHKGKFSINKSDLIGNSKGLNDRQKDTINSVLEYYGNRSARWLSSLAHLEDPWKKARKGMNPRERGNSVISLESMAEYYSSINYENAVFE